MAVNPTNKEFIWGYEAGLKKAGQPVAINAGQVAYDDSASYTDGTVGGEIHDLNECCEEVSADVAQLKSHISNLDESKANIDGYYESMTVGNAEQIVSTVGVEDRAPYVFRTTGGSADVGDRATDMVVGGTVAWNQLASYNKSDYSVGAATFTTLTDGFSLTSTSNSSTPKSAWMKIVKDHVYCATAELKISDETYSALFGLYTSGGTQLSAKTTKSTTFERLTMWFKPADGTNRFYFRMSNSSAQGTVMTVRHPMVIDVTLLFGATIADYVRTLETGTPGAGTAWLKRFFPKDNYAYNAGTLINVRPTAHKTVGFNAYNHTAGTAKLVGGNEYQITGAYTALAYEDVSGNAETITPDSDGYFTPSASGTLTVTGGNATTTCVHLVWDGERDDEWEEYTEHNYALDDSLALNGMAMLDSDDRLYYHGDTYESDGTVTRYFHELIDLSSLTWTYVDPEVSTDYASACFRSNKPASPYTYASAVTIVCSKYRAISNRALYNIKSLTSQDKVILWDTSNNRFFIFDSDYTDAESLTAALTGHYATYRVNDSGITTESADPFVNPQIVDDFGTEEYVTTPQGDVEMPTGHKTQYQANLRAKLEMAPDSPDADGDYIVRHANGQNTYVPITFPADELPAAPAEDGTYALTVTVADGEATYSWGLQT